MSVDLIVAVLVLMLPVPIFAVGIIIATRIFYWINPGAAGWFVTALIAAVGSAYALFLSRAFRDVSWLNIISAVLGVLFIILALLGCYQTYAKKHNDTQR